MLRLIRPVFIPGFRSTSGREYGQQQSSNLIFFSIKVIVKVTRSLTLVSFKWGLLVEYAIQI